MVIRGSSALGRVNPAISEKGVFEVVLKEAGKPHLTCRRRRVADVWSGREYLG